MKNWKFAVLVNRVLDSINYHPVHTFWNVDVRSRCDAISFAEIRFQTNDNVFISVNICKDEVSVIVYIDDSCTHYKWLGSCNLTQEHSYDTFMMWLGYKLCNAYDFASNLE